MNRALPQFSRRRSAAQSQTIKNFRTLLNWRLSQFVSLPKALLAYLFNPADLQISALLPVKRNDQSFKF